MTVPEFIAAISDDKGPIKSTAIDVLEYMTPKQLEQLVAEMKSNYMIAQQQRDQITINHAHAGIYYKK